MSDFCRYCGSRIPPVYGEGTCEHCDPEGSEANRIILASVDVKQKEEGDEASRIPDESKPGDLSQ